MEPPHQKKKKTVALGGMFETAKAMKRAREAAEQDDAPAPKSKKRTPPSFLSQFNKRTQHPLYRSFADTAREYTAAAATSLENAFEPAYDSLLTRLDGLDPDGTPLARPGYPSQTDWDDLHATETLLAVRLEDRIMTLKLPQPGGGARITNLPLGESLRLFRARYDAKRGELVALEELLRAVDEEVAELKRAVLGGDEELRVVEKGYEEELAGLEAEVEGAREVALAEIAEAEKEERRATKEFNRKVKEFCETLE